jgi:DNA polymerase III subunit delta'
VSDTLPLHAVQGHETIREALARALMRGTLPASILLHGPAGVGKQRLALWLGQALVCDSPGPQGGCGECRGCRMALRIEHPDIYWTMPVARPKGSLAPDRLAAALEEVRGEALIRSRQNPIRPVGPDPDEDSRPRGIYVAAVQSLRVEALRTPSLARQRLYLIAEAQFLVPQESSPEAANALLKLLEEPPPHAVFVLTSSEPGRLLPTIRSRTVPVHVGPLPRAQVESFLVSHGQATSDTASRAAALGEGSIGRALGFLPREGGTGDGALEELRQEARSLLAAALNGSRGERFGVAMTQSTTGARGLLDLLASLETWLRDLAAAAVGAESAIINHDGVQWLRDVSRRRRIHPEGVDRAREAVDRTRVMASGNVNPQLLLAGLLRELADQLIPETSR